MAYSFLSVQLGVRNQGQAASLGISAYSCLSPSSLGVKSDSVLDLPPWVFFHSPEKILEKMFFSSQHFALQSQQ